MGLEAERAAICKTGSFIGMSVTLVSLGAWYAIALLTGVVLIIVWRCQPPGDQVVSPSSGRLVKECHGDWILVQDIFLYGYYVLITLTI